MTWHTVFRRWLAAHPALDRIEFANVSLGPRSTHGDYCYVGPVVTITHPVELTFHRDAFALVYPPYGVST